MTLDIRATVTCSLGELISGSVGDTSIGNSGLVTCSGSIVVSGTIAPVPGTEVTFSYSAGGQSYTIPRRLRVIGSYADPFRRVSQISLGDKLAYLASLEEYSNYDAKDDPNSDADAPDFANPIHASTILEQCLQKLEINLAGANPLTNKFANKYFPLDRPFVAIMNDLLVSESYCGYLNYNEELEIVDLSQKGGTGPLLTVDDFIDIGPAGLVVPPADLVKVSYKYQKHQRVYSPEGSSGLVSSYNISGLSISSNSNWTEDKTIGPDTEYPINYVGEEGEELTETYSGRSESITKTYYKSINVRNGVDPSTGRIVYEKKELVDYTESEVTEPYAKIASKRIAALLSRGQTATGGSARVVTKKSRTTPYYDANGEVVGEENYEEVPIASYIYGSELPVAFSRTATLVEVVPYIDTILVPASRTVTTYNKKEDLQKTYTVTYVNKGETAASQASLAESVFALSTTAGAVNLAEKTFNSGLVFEGDSVRISRVSSARLRSQAKPTESESASSYVTSKDYGGSTSSASSGDKYTTEVFELANNASNGLVSNVLQLTVPYSPDDTIGYVSGVYSTIRGGAAENAKKYGETQVNLINGGVYSINIQLPVNKLSGAIFEPIVVEANGLSAMYRVDALNWTIGANGIIVSASALFYGAVGGTGDFWFPVAPGIVSLPQTPPAINGQVTVVNTVPITSQKIKYQTVFKTRLSLRAYDYPLINDLGFFSLQVKSRLLLGVFATPVRIPATIITFSAHSPELEARQYIKPPGAAIVIDHPIPLIKASDGKVYPAQYNIQVNAYSPIVTAPQPAIVNVGITSVFITATAPNIALQRVVVVPSTEIQVGAYLPIVATSHQVYIPVTALSELSAFNPEIFTGVAIYERTETPGVWSEVASDVNPYESDGLTLVEDSPFFTPPSGRYPKIRMTALAPRVLVNTRIKAPVFTIIVANTPPSIGARLASNYSDWAFAPYADLIDIWPESWNDQ